MKMPKYNINLIESRFIEYKHSNFIISHNLVYTPYLN